MCISFAPAPTERGSEGEGDADGGRELRDSRSQDSTGRPSPAHAYNPTPSSIQSIPVSGPPPPGPQRSPAGCGAADQESAHALTKHNATFYMGGGRKNRLPARFTDGAAAACCRGGLEGREGSARCASSSRPGEIEETTPLALFSLVWLATGIKGRT